MAAPFIKGRTGTTQIMADVIIALVPVALASYWAFGADSLLLISVCVFSSLLSDLCLGYLFLSRKAWSFDASGIITGLLLAFTLSPFTPWFIAAFGGVMASLFGKVLWGGTGTNQFNPALVGREFMVFLFPAIMNNGGLWNVSKFAENPGLDLSGLFNTSALAQNVSKIIFSPVGALGEYSSMCLLVGAFYLLLRRRISWHIPVAFFVAFWFVRSLFPAAALVRFSTGGVLLGVLFMATDMPTSPAHKNGKLYFGMMLGLVTALLLQGGVKFAYMSYSILILNGFTQKINELLKPTPHGRHVHLRSRIEPCIYLTLAIGVVTLAVISLSYTGFIHLPVYVLIFYLLSRVFVTPKPQTPVKSY